MTDAAPIDEALAAQVRSLLAEAGPATVPSGVLLWLGDTALPEGLTADDAPPLDQQAFLDAYLRLAGGQVAASLPSPLVLLGGAQPGDAVPLAIASVAFDRPTRGVVDAVMAAGAAGVAADLPATLSAAIEPAETTLATLLLAPQFLRTVPVHRGRVVRVVLDPDLLLTNRGGSIADVALDAGDGWQPLAAGAEVTVTVPAGAASVDVRVRCTTAAGVRHATCRLGVSDVPVPAPPDETWTIGPPGVGVNTGRAFVFRGSTGNRMSRPVLIAEGFPGGHSWQELADCLDQHGLMTRLRAAGHDVVVIGFDDGTAAIQSNTGVIRTAIEMVADRTTDALVVGGMSMGGLVARCALLEMERDRVDHRAAVYLSLDTPHGRGAYTTVQGQWFVNHFTSLSVSFLGLEQQIVAPANRQFVMLLERDGAVAPDPLRTELLAELARLGGYPRRPVRLGVSCGNGAGAVRAAPAAPIFDWQVPGIAGVRWLPTPAGGTATIASGATLAVPGGAPPPLTVTTDACWETVPGATNVLNAIVTSVLSGMGCPFGAALGASSAVPTVSALDVDGDPTAPIGPPGTSGSPFHDHVSPATDQFHLQFPADVVDWIVDRVERHQPRNSEAPPMTSTAPGPNAPASFDPSTFSFYDPAFIADPYPVYDWFRANEPIVELDLVRGVDATKATWVFRWADVNEVLTDTETYLKRMPGQAPSLTTPPVFGALGALPPGLLGSDPPRHDVVRRQVEPPFLAALADAPASARATAASIVAGFGPSRQFELVSQFALPLPQAVLAQVLGYPAGDMAVLPTWAQGIATAHDITQPAQLLAFGGTCAFALRTYVDALIAEHQAGTGTVAGMLGGVCAALGPTLTTRDVQAVMSDMLVAGYLTTTYLISTGLRALFQHPDQLQRLRDDPSLLQGAVMELLRYEAPAQFLDRVVAVDTVLGGVPLRAGTHLVLGIGSANRDSSVFANGDELDITRDTSASMGFGWGIHHCIGAPLASIVAPIAIETLLGIPGLRIDGLASWQPDPYLRGMTSLPMAFDG